MPCISKFTQMDQIKKELNWSFYASDNPLAIIDPSGYYVQKAHEWIATECGDWQKATSLRDIIAALGKKYIGELFGFSKFILPNKNIVLWYRVCTETWKTYTYDIELPYYKLINTEEGVGKSFQCAVNVVEKSRTNLIQFLLILVVLSVCQGQVLYTNPKLNNSRL